MWAVGLTTVLDFLKYIKVDNTFPSTTFADVTLGLFLVHHRAIEILSISTSMTDATMFSVNIRFKGGKSLGLSGLSGFLHIFYRCGNPYPFRVGGY